MTRTCKCGGRIVPQTGRDASSKYMARFKCDRCGKRYYQRKRLPKEKP